MSLARDQIKPLELVFDDDGLIPNTPLPLLLYKRAIDVSGREPEQAIEELFRLPPLSCHRA